ncbi:carbohydrate ABC transporter permease [Kineococcus rhizosphaerae]|uniref:Multiple sugar transport system permease protein n=1 Tax=Kineococcus rhizosphaerae TaxID=559628 RepID=A0A2T0QXS5_9ACTN|nr:carbohydrate ABC transporter permease [Kineococcus rhizosphaerae]PRY10846.1 multiple sugar transport system permease protein [Kineococcus rhizosphaerae]
MTVHTGPGTQVRGLAQVPVVRAVRRRPPVVTGVLLGIVCVVTLAPFVWMALSVTKPTNVAFANPPVLTGYTPTLQAFVNLWQTTYFADYLTNTIVVAVISTVIALLIGIPAAYALSRFPSYVSALLLVLALVFRALPRFSVVLPMYDISRALGIYDTTFALAVALVAINQPFTIWLLRNFFAEIPRELDEAAMIDGCTRIGMLRRVMIPLMRPGILTAGIFVFLFAFQEYLTALVLTDSSSKTVPVFIATQLGQTLPMLQQAGAASLLLTLPVVVIAFVAQKYLVAGLSDGAVKG